MSGRTRQDLNGLVSDLFFGHEDPKAGPVRPGTRTAVSFDVESRRSRRMRRDAVLAPKRTPHIPNGRFNSPCHEVRRKQWFPKPRARFESCRGCFPSQVYLRLYELRPVLRGLRLVFACLGGADALESVAASARGGCPRSLIRGSRRKLDRRYEENLARVGLIGEAAGEKTLCLPARRKELDDMLDLFTHDAPEARKRRMNSYGLRPPPCATARAVLNSCSSVGDRFKRRRGEGVGVLVLGER
jgi:hypothetical protein